MKLKRTIFNICLMILAFLATGAIVVYANYYNFETETENNISSNQNQQASATESEESKFLNSLLSTIMTSENLSGTLLVNGDGNTAVEGKIYYDSTSSTPLYTKIDGVYKDNSISLTAGMVNDELFVEFLGVKFKVNTQNALNAVLELTSGATSGDFSSMLNLETLQELLEDMKITENELGGKTISLTIPDFTTLTIVANKNNFPTLIKTGAVTIGSERITLTLMLDTTSKTMPSISTKGYTEFLLDENTTQVVTTIMNIIQSGGVNLRGTLTINNSSVATLQAIIDKNLNIKLSIVSSIATADFYYYNGNFYLDSLGNKIKVDANGVSKYLSSIFGASTTSSTPKITMLNSTTFEVLDNKIAIGVTDGNILDISVSGKNYEANLSLESGKSEVIFSESGFSTISFSSLCNTTKSLLNHLDATKFDLTYNGTIGENSANIYGYFELDNLNSLKNLCMNAYIGNNHFAVYYKDGYYFLNTDGGAKVKYSATALDGLLSYLSTNLNLSAISMSSIEELINELQLKIVLKSASRINFQTTFGSLNVDIFSSSIKISSSDLKISELELSGNLKIEPNSNYYSKYLKTIEPDTYNDLSSTTDAVNSLVSTLKSNSKFSGNVSLTLGKVLGISTNITLVDLSVKVRSVYQNGTLGIEIVLGNLPTNPLLTDYSSIFYSKHTSTIQIVGGKMQIKRTIYGRTTKKTFVETSKIINLSDFSADNLGDILGLKSSIIKKFKSSSSDTSIDLNANAIIKGIYATDQTLGVNLAPALNKLNVTKFDTQINHKAGSVTTISLDAKLKNAIGIKLKLSRV